MQIPDAGEQPPHRIYTLLASVILGKVYLVLFLESELPLFILVPEKPADVAIHASFAVLALVLIYYDDGPLFAFLIFFVPAFDLYFGLQVPAEDISYAPWQAVTGLVLIASMVALGYTILQQLGRFVYRWHVEGERPGF